MNPRALLLALALQATPQGKSRLARFARRKTACFATLLVDPRDFRLLGFIENEDGVDLLWQETRSPRLAVRT
jgi:hypothetical protein